MNVLKNSVNRLTMLLAIESFVLRTLGRLLFFIQWCFAIYFITVTADAVQVLLSCLLPGGSGRNVGMWQLSTSNITKIIGKRPRTSQQDSE